MVVKVKSVKTVIIDPKTVHIINHLKGVDFEIHCIKDHFNRREEIAV